MKIYAQFKAELLKNEEIAKAYDDFEQEFVLIKFLVGCFIFNQ
jgi:hypothetical protein